jgi:methionyl-tRNA formyltransferase
MQEKKPEKLNFAFFGTPDVALETLEILKQSGYMPSLVITSPDKPQGRKMIVTPPPVKVWAQENNIPYIQPEKLSEEELENFFATSSQADEPRKAIFQQENMRESKKVFQFDLFIVVAYGKIIPEDILYIPKLGSINIHYSLLPKYRGASPVESAILNGETDTGVSIQKMVFKMDAGPVIAENKVEILSAETAPELRQRLIKVGADLLVKTLPKIASGEIEEKVQDESKVSLSKKIKKEDGLIDLSDDPVKNYNKFRAYAHWPRTFFFKDGKRIIITKARLEDNKFVIEKIIPEGGKETDYRT